MSEGGEEKKEDFARRFCQDYDEAMGTLMLDCQRLIKEKAELREENERLRTENAELAKLAGANLGMMHVANAHVARLRAKYEGEGARDYWGVVDAATGNIFLQSKEREHIEEARKHKRFDKLLHRVVRFREVRE